MNQTSTYPCNGCGSQLPMSDWPHRLCGTCAGRSARSRHAAPLSEEPVFTDRGASSLSRVMELKQFIKALNEELATLEKRLKDELTSNPDPIVDGEHGLVATMRERRGTADFDLISMAQRPEMERLLVEAAREGLLTVRTTTARAQKGHSEAADVLLSKYEMPGPVSYVLTVERI